MKSLQEELQDIFDGYGEVTKVEENIDATTLARFTLSFTDTTFAPLNYMLEESKYYKKKLPSNFPRNINTSISFKLDLVINIRERADIIIFTVNRAKFDFTDQPEITASKSDLMLAKNYMKKMKIYGIDNSDDIKGLSTFVEKFYTSRIQTLTDNHIEETNDYIDHNYRELTHVVRKCL